MELKLLASFVAVAEQLSFIRASRQLYLSQPALTGQIQKLEEEIGVQLLIRNRRTVQLTDAGRIFLSEARATLARAQQAVERTQKAARGEIGRLRIGFVSSAVLQVVPDIVVAFRRQHKGVGFDLVNLRTVSQVKALLGKTIDVGFLRMPLSHDQLKITVVHREVFALVLPRGHAQARARRVSIADLRDEPFVAYGRRWAPGFFDAVVRMCNHEGFTPNIIQETAEMYTAISLVAAGIGVAILPESVVLAQAKNIVVKPLPASAGISEIAIAMRKDERSQLVHSFVRLASQMERGEL